MDGRTDGRTKLYVKFASLLIMIYLRLEQVFIQRRLARSKQVCSCNNNAVMWYNSVGCFAC